ncbi:formate dehydrogenase accessory sulfurtransferase FdhD [Microvirga rosea]|uniref:formate dehydrogenase accessory sulfurtransferase FdhD n=1 Tax=Microvirga rosea TaxID=2715425 RepID=UPI001D0A2C84|nr:formate dehydrogenase accessory sulfurtransferase FdhD [Microvirga rosea]MCB8823063.1 formate dehydrogenase accessory sulfurtransferase FdhD [Microvirga rosea]
MPRSKTRSVLPVSVEVRPHVISFGSGSCLSVERFVPAEEPVNIVYAGMPFAVMMASPADLEDFAVGFSLTEGVIGQVDDIRSIHIEREERGIKIMMDLSSERLHAHLARKRALAGGTGCGLCGIEDLDALPKARPVSGHAPSLSPEHVLKALAALEVNQPLNEATHAVHAAAWADLGGNVCAVREDVGRHNALDKLIGALLRSSTPPNEGFFIMTSRCSYELVEKVASFGGRTLVTISAPTSLALERARLHDMTLIALARHDTMTVFHGRERLSLPDASS